MLFDYRSASAPGVALATGMTTDSLDRHYGLIRPKDLSDALFSLRSFLPRQRWTSKARNFSLLYRWDINSARPPPYHNIPQCQIIIPPEAGERYSSGRLRKVDAPSTRRNATRAWHCLIPWPAQPNDALYCSLYDAQIRFRLGGNDRGSCCQTSTKGVYRCPSHHSGRSR